MHPTKLLPLRYLANKKLSVFLFHKVPGQVDPLMPYDLDLCSFEQLLDSVVSAFNVIPLDEAVAGLLGGNLPLRAACITFDDGYDTWLPGVIPALERRNMHATFYITTGQFEGRPLWHERIANVVRCAPGPLLDIVHPACAPLPVVTQEERSAAVVQLERFLKYFAVEARDELLHRMECAVGTGPEHVTRMSTQDLRTIHNHGFGIGAHTDNHPILVYCDQADAMREIGAVRETLAGYVGGPIRSFAYPNGRPYADFSAQHVEMVKKAGFTSAVTTQRGIGLGGADWVYQIPRFTPWGRNSLSISLQLARNLLTPAKFVDD
jgi:peptidoglycan/xylan/chitin deacetylase (PgdA/CDA1 family)